MNKKINQSKRTITLYFFGFSMGLADLVPGVSGGTVALLFGIYDELLQSIKIVTGEVVGHVLKGRFKNARQAIPFSFLVPLFAGIVSAIFGLVMVITYLLEHQPVFIWSLFFGLIIGSVYVVSKRIPAWNIALLSMFGLGFVLTYLLVGLPALNADSNAATMFGTGAIASTAMILPGISGSLIMVLLGQYENVIAAVSDRDFLLIGVFAAGAIIGLGIFTRVLSWLLEKYHNLTMAFLIGVMLGSLRKVWPWQVETGEKMFKNFAPSFDAGVLGAVCLMVVGFIIVWRLEKVGVAREHDVLVE